jgi:hypothetical protein
MRAELRSSCHGELFGLTRRCRCSYGDIAVTSWSRARLGVQNERRKECD